MLKALGIQLTAPICSCKEDDNTCWAFVLEGGELKLCVWCRRCQVQQRTLYSTINAWIEVEDKYAKVSFEPEKPPGASKAN